MSRKPSLSQCSAVEERRRSRSVLSVAGIFALATVLAVFGIAVLPTEMSGATPTGKTYYVNSAIDTGATDCAVATNSDCGIDDAITAFNADTTPGDADAIVFSSAIATFTVGTPTDVDNTTSGVTLAIDGNGQSTTAVSGNNVNSVFVILGGTATISGLTIEDGAANTTAPGEGPAGGGIHNDGTLTLTGATVSDNTADSGYGGGIFNGGTLTVNDSTVSNNTSAIDGGISSGGGALPPTVLTVTDSTVSGNSGPDGGGIVNLPGSAATVTDSTVSNNYGGGIVNDQGDTTQATTLTATDVTVYNNFADYGIGNIEGATAIVTGSTVSENSAGGIFNGGGTLTVTGSTVSDNSGSEGAGVANGSQYGAGTLNLTDSTVSGNSATEYGGGIYDDGTTTNVIHSTISGNTAGAGYGAGGGIYNSPGGPPFSAQGSVTLVATIVANSGSGLDCAGTAPPVTDNGYNLDDDGSCGFGSANGSLSDTPADLDPVGLQNNGGSTQTVALEAGSPAIGAVTDASDCTGTDQTGVGWPTPCDIGAVSAVFPATVPLVVTVSGSQTYGSTTPTFTYSSSAVVALSGTLSCATVNGGTTIGAGLPAGPYTVSGTSCSGLTAPTGYTLSYAGATNGFVVSNDSTTTSLKASPASEVYGNESGTTFTVKVTTGNGEVIPSTGETVSVTVGTANCTATLTPGGNGGSGTCTIGSTALGVVGSPYTASARYGGGPDLSASPSAGTAPFSVGAAAQAVTLTSTPPIPAVVGATYALSANGGGSGNPVTFSIDGSSGSGVCSLGSDHKTVSFVTGGTCVIDANQAGNADYIAATQVQQSITVTWPAACMSISTVGSSVTTVTGTYSGNYVVANGTTLYLKGGTVSGNVTVGATGSFFAQGGTVGGNVQSSGGPVSLQGTTVDGNVTTQGASLALGPTTHVKGNVQVTGGATLCSSGNTQQGSVQIAGNLQVESLGASSNPTTICDSAVSGNFLYEDDAAPGVFGGSIACSGNSVGGNLQVQDNTGKVTIGGTGYGNTVKGNIQVNNNTGGGTLTDNSAGGNCQLQSDSPGIVGSGNTAGGQNTGNKTA